MGTEEGVDGFPGGREAESQERRLNLWRTEESQSSTEAVVSRGRPSPWGGP